jgi:GT2 family glycosyltransferase
MSKVHNSLIGSPSPFNGEVDIVVAYHGQYEKLTALLDSIFRFTRSNYYRVCIIDDASPNADFSARLKRNAIKNAELRRVENNIDVVRLDQQRGFAGALKVGYENTTSPYICFINSDCKVEDVNWLRGMGESLLSMKEQDVRMVAPVTNNAVGGHPEQEGDKKARSLDHFILPGNEHLSLYCVLCHRELFNRCGGFLKEYPFGGYEDMEFAARMQHSGFKQAVCKSTWIYHEGGATIKSLWRQRPDLQAVMQKDNRQRYIDDLRKLS